MSVRRAPRSSFDLINGLQGQGGVLPIDKTQVFTIDEPPLLKVVVKWRSVVE